MSNLITISGVRGYIDEIGTAQLNLEDVARGLGFTTVATSGNDVIRWNRVAGYLTEFGACTEVYVDLRKTTKTIREQLPEFIPENIFYRLAMKAKNEVAQQFQIKVADEILPAIRKHGGYLTPAKIEQALLNPDTIIKLATTLKEERIKNQQLTQVIGELKPKADYTDRILRSKGTVTITSIAKDYGMSGTEMNKLLHDIDIQYKQSNIWLLYKKYQDKGYTHSKTIDYTDSKGMPQTRMTTQWTQKGRLFLYETLKNKGILPMIEITVSA